MNNIIILTIACDTNDRKNVQPINLLKFIYELTYNVQNIEALIYSLFLCIRYMGKQSHWRTHWTVNAFQMRGVSKQLIDRILSIHLMSYQYHLQTMEMPLCEWKTMKHQVLNANWFIIHSSLSDIYISTCVYVSRSIDIKKSQ